ncbi:MAG: hypothetical protein Q9212_002853 [Teloschistes hypoglaucus]
MADHTATTTAAAGQQNNGINSPAQAQEVAGLLTLPSEIRLEIYDYLIESQTFAITWSHPSPSDRRALRSQGKSVRKQFRRTRRTNGEVDHPAAIFQTSHLLRQETLALFFRRTRFRFDFGADSIFGLNAFYDHGLGDPAHAAHIRTIELDLNLITERYRRWRDVSLVTRLGGWLRQFPEVEELKLVYPHELARGDFCLGKRVPEKVIERQGAWLKRKVKILVESHKEVRGAGPLAAIAWLAHSQGLLAPGVTWGPGDLSRRRIDRLVWIAGSFLFDPVSFDTVERSSGRIMPGP